MPTSQPLNLPKFSERIDRLGGSLIREILSLTQQPDMISFAGGLPAEAVMPTLDFSRFPPALRQYGPSEGEPGLRAAVSAHVRSLGIDATPAQVLILSGSQQGLDLVSKLFIDPGTPVMVEAPSYLAALQCFRLFGARFLELALSPQGVDAADITRQAGVLGPAFAYLIPTFQNPTGYCYSAQTRTAVAAAIDAANIVLVEDEPYRDLAYDPVDRTPICAQLKRAQWIYLGSFSKTGAPGLRTGFAVASPALAPYLLKLKQATDLHTNRVGQWLAEQWLTAADRPAQLDHLRDYYRIQRDAMQAALTRHLGDIAEWQAPPGGLFFWVRLKPQLDSGTLLDAALARKVAFMPGEPFYPLPRAHTGELRLNFSHSSAGQIDRGIATLREVIDELVADVNVKSGKKSLE